MAEKRDGTPKLGGKMAIILFGIVLLAFVVESQLTQVHPRATRIERVSDVLYCPKSMSKPISVTASHILFCRPRHLLHPMNPPDLYHSYLVHSAFSLIFPLHLLYLLARTDCTSRTLFNSLRIAISEHLSGPGTPFPRRKFTLLVFALTVGITFPSLLWFAAISLAS
jgi:hypothetical protein